MVKEVVKRDGSREPFDPTKIMKSIELAAREAGLDDGKIQALVKEVGGSAIQFAGTKEVISTSALKYKIMSDLDKRESSVSAAWRRFDAAKKK